MGNARLARKIPSPDCPEEVTVDGCAQYNYCMVTRRAVSHRLLIVLLVAFVSLAARGADRPPNVVMIFVDDMGYGDLTCYGSKGPATPNLDRMAKEGVRFTDFYVAQAVCSASRCALLTGCYNVRLGILGALGPKAKVGLNPAEFN